MKIRIFILCLVIFANGKLWAQSRIDNWCFGDSIKMKFVNGDLIPDSLSFLYCQEANVSISDNAGNLLFYAGCKGYQNIAFFSIWNENDSVMPNGDAILGHTSVTNGLMILPSIVDSNLYYILSVFSFAGLRYSLVDMSLDSGRGEVTVQNSVVITDTLVEKLAAVRHANGKDWWVLVHKSGSISDSTKIFYQLLLDSTGIALVDSQEIGSYYNAYSSHNRGITGEMIFSEDGSKLCAVGFGMIDLFDFNRCTGKLSNFQSLTIPPIIYPRDNFYGCSFSSMGTKLYVSDIPSELNFTFQHIYQYDLTSPNIPASRVTLYLNTIDSLGIGQHQLGPNGKIYISSCIGPIPITYDTIYNRNLTVINSPDSAGAACDLQMFSVPVGLGKTYLGLPNNPNYELGSLEVNCDSITDIHFYSDVSEIFDVYPNPSNGLLQIQLKNINNNRGQILLYNIQGKKVIQRDFDKDDYKFNLDLINLCPGIYFIQLSTEEFNLVRRIVRL